MLPEKTVLRVRQMLLAGELSQRQIARHLRIGRATVGEIASTPLNRTQSPAALHAEAERGSSQRVLVRCSGCGGMVWLPCRLCEVRTMLDEKQASRRQDHVEAQQAFVRQILIESLRRERQRDAAERVGPRKAG